MAEGRTQYNVFIDKAFGILAADLNSDKPKLSTKGYSQKDPPFKISLSSLLKDHPTKTIDLLQNIELAEHFERFVNKFNLAESYVSLLSGLLKKNELNEDELIRSFALLKAIKKHDSKYLTSQLIDGFYDKSFHCFREKEDLSDTQQALLDESVKFLEVTNSVINEKQFQDVLSKLKSADEGSRKLVVLNHGTSIADTPGKREDLLFNRIAAFLKNALTLRGVGANPKLGSRAFNTAVAFGKKGIQKRIREVKLFLQKADGEGFLPDTVDLVGYSRGAVAAIKQAQAIYELYGDRVKINLTLDDPVIGPFDGLKEKDLKIPENVQSLIVTQAAEEPSSVYRGIDATKLDYNSEKTVVTVIGLPGRHLDQNKERSRRQAGGFEAIDTPAFNVNEKVLEKQLNPEAVEGNPFEANLDDIHLRSNDGRLTAFYSSPTQMSDDLPENIRALHENLRGVIDSKLVQEKEPVQNIADIDQEAIKSLDALSQVRLFNSVCSNINLEEPNIDFNTFKKMLTLIESIQQSDPGALPSSETLNPFITQVIGGFKNEFYGEDFIFNQKAIVKWNEPAPFIIDYLESLDKRHPQKKQVRLFRSEFSRLIESDDHGSYFSGAEQKNFDTLSSHHLKYQIKKNPLSAYSSEIEKGENEPLKESVREFQRHFESVQSKLLAKNEEIEGFEQFLESYREVMGLEPFLPNVEGLQASAKKAVVDILKNKHLPHLIPNNPEGLSVVSVETQLVKAGENNIIKSKDVRSFEKSIAIKQLQYSSVEDAPNWVEKLLEEVSKENFQLKGINYTPEGSSNSLKIKITELLRSTNTAPNVIAFYQKAIEQVPPKSFKKMLKQQKYRSNLGGLKESLDGFLNEFLENLDNNNFINVLTALQTIRKREPGGIDHEQWDDYKENIVALVPAAEKEAVTRFFEGSSSKGFDHIHKIERLIDSNEDFVLSEDNRPEPPDMEPNL